MNSILVIGEIVESPKRVHYNFYRMLIKTYRYSGVPDFIPVMVSRDMVQKHYLEEGRRILIDGYLKTSRDFKKHLKLYVMVKHIEMVYYKENRNVLYLSGSVAKQPNYRKTPFGREITDLIIKVKDGKDSSYIPAIAWGRNAIYTSTFEIGSPINIEGRFQSREYLKHDEKRMTFEISIKNIK